MNEVNDNEEEEEEEVEDKIKPRHSTADVERKRNEKRRRATTRAIVLGRAREREMEVLRGRCPPLPPWLFRPNVPPLDGSSDFSAEASSSPLHLLWLRHKNSLKTQSGD